MEFQKEARLRDTSISKIPRDWVGVRLGEILELKNGERPKVDESGVIPIYGANGIMGKTNDKLVNSDFTIIFGRVGASGETHLAKGRIWVSDNAIYSEDYNKEKGNLSFLFYLLKFKDLKRFATKTTHPIITQTFLKNYQVPLPPLPEQQKIAEILSTVDEGIGKVDQAIERTRRVKKGLMQQLLTKGIGHTEFRDTRIGRIPRKWEVARVSDICEVKGGKRLPKGHKLVGSRTAHPYIRVVDFRNMSVDTGNLEYLAPETHEFIRRYTISLNDVYISIAGTVGLVGIIPRELDGANLTENAAKLCNLRNITKDFLAYFLNSVMGINQISALVGKAQQPKLALFRIEKIGIPLPPIPEQDKITGIVSTVDKMLELLGKKKEKLERIKKGLMNDLLTGKKRVRVEK